MVVDHSSKVQNKVICESTFICNLVPDQRFPTVATKSSIFKTSHDLYFVRIHKTTAFKRQRTVLAVHAVHCTSSFLTFISQ